jgi:hypothetical protein
MTFDGTRVDTDELAAFSRGALDRAGRTTTAADTVAGTHLGSDMLGAFSLAFLDSARADQTETVSLPNRTSGERDANQPQVRDQAEPSFPTQPTH